MVIPITINTSSIKKFLDHVQNAGIPPKVSNPYLKSVGFKSSNDSALINVFKALDFIDNGGSPTEKWQQYRNKAAAPTVLGTAIKGCYAELFQVYPDAYRKDDEAITNFIKEHSKLADLSVARAVKTFKALCEQAKFDDGDPAASQESPMAGLADAMSPVRVPRSSGMPISINIELQLPATADADVYNKLFKAMKQHLLSDEQA